MRQEFIGFSFCDIHSSKFNIFAISDGSSYTMPLFANFQDSTETVDGFDGVYYFGTHFTSKPRVIHCFVQNADENILRSIQHWLRPNRMGKLTFDEAPYKYYIAKVTSTPSFSYYPQSDGVGGHLYSGFFDVEFTAFDPFASSYVNSVDDYTYFEESQALWFYDSGILYHEETPPVLYENITGNKNVILYNGGNTRSKPVVTIQGTADEVTVANFTTGQQFTLKGLKDNVTMVVDCNKGHVRVDEVLANSYHEGDYIEIDGSGRVSRATGTFATGSNKVIFKDDIDFDIIGRYIAFHYNWYKVTNCDFGTKTVTIDRVFEGETEEYEFSIIDMNELLITGINMNLIKVEFDYKFRYY